MSGEASIRYEDAYAILEVDGDRSILRLQWKGFAHGPAYRQVLERSLTLIDQHGLRYFLADSRQMGPILYEDEQWTTREVTPRFQGSSLKRIAILPSHDLFNRMSVDRMVEVSAPKSPYQIAYFREVAEAEAWLFGREKAIA